MSSISFSSFSNISPPREEGNSTPSNNLSLASNASLNSNPTMNFTGNKWQSVNNLMRSKNVIYASPSVSTQMPKSLKKKKKKKKPKNRRKI